MPLPVCIVFGVSVCILRCVIVCVSVSVCARAPLCIHQPATRLSSDTPLSLQSRKITLAVSLADVAGMSPKDRRGETIPTKWHELMWLINTTLIICKLHVWVHVTWEAYVACCVHPNKCQLICIWSAPRLKTGQSARCREKKTRRRRGRKGGKERERKNMIANKKKIESCLDSMHVFFFCHFVFFFVWSLFVLCAVGECVIWRPIKR